MLATIGTTMIVRMKAAASSPTLEGVPENTGMNPRYLIRKGSTCASRNGPITRMPHSPSTTLGMAARSSTSAPTGARSRRGANSLRKSPMAIATGTAITSAISDVTSVPQIRSSAPYWSVTAFHSLEVRNRNPNVDIADQP